MRITLFSKILTGFIISLILIVGLGTLDFLSTIKLTDSFNSLEESKNRVIVLQEAESVVKDIQRAHRGFVVTHDKRFLDPYFHSIEQVPKIKSQLKTQDWHDAQKPGIRNIITLIDKKVRLAEDALLNPINVSHADSTIKRIFAGKVLVDSINVLIATTKSYELRQQRQTEEGAQQWVSRNKTIIVSTILVFVVLLTIGMYELYRSLLERYKLVLDLQHKNKEINEKNEELNTLIEGLNKTNSTLNETVRKLEEATVQLHLNERQLTHAQLISRTGSFQINLQTSQFTYSPSFARILDLDDETHLKDLAEFKGRIHPDDRHLIHDQSEKLSIVEVRYPTADTVKYLRVAGEVVTEGNDRFYMGAISDITELKEALLQLMQSHADLESFSYSISHDLKSPIRSIVMHSELLQENNSLHTDDKKKLALISQKGLQMNELIDGLLSLAQLGSIALRKTLVDMDALVAEIIEEMRSYYPSSSVNVINKLGHVNVDARLIRQVWINLLSNAFKFSSKVESPAITISAMKNEVHVEYKINDNGVGFDALNDAEIFGAFKRFHNKEFSGTGIGLAIVKRIITTHGGEVAAESQKGKGATFTFTLPDAR
jgi:signal transduction histidine kinase